MDEDRTQPVGRVPAADPSRPAEVTARQDVVAPVIFDDQPAEPRERRGWAASAVAVIVALGVSTAGAVGWAIVERSRVGDTRRELATARADAAGLADRVGELRAASDEQAAQLDAARRERSAADQDAAATQASLDAANDQLAALVTRYERLAALFPVSAEAIAGSEMAGTYALANTAVAERCTGFSDPAATCVAANFPPDLTISGTTAAGYVASSSWFGDVTLGRDGPAWSGSGAMADTVSNTCNGVPNPTTVELRVQPSGALPGPGEAALIAAGLSGTITVTSPATTDCVATERSAEFVTGAG